MRISSRYIIVIVSFFSADGEDHHGCRRPPTPPESVASYYRDGVCDREQERKGKRDRVEKASWRRVMASFGTRQRSLGARHLSREKREMGASCRSLLQKDLYLPKLPFEVLGPMRIYRGVTRLQFALNTKIIEAVLRKPPKKAISSASLLGCTSL